MSQHPLLLISILVMLGIGLGTIIGMLLLVLRSQDQQRRELRGWHNDIDEQNRRSLE